MKYLNSETFFHQVRWILAIALFVLIFSMFYDPVSAQWTELGSFFAPRTDCVQFQGECRLYTAYPMGARIFWGMIIPMAIISLVLFGHGFWRRVCPLSFLSQLPRALRKSPRPVIAETHWLNRYSTFIQFGLLFVGLTVRLLLINSDRVLLGIFLLLTILVAMTINLIFDGKTWCNYVCPFGSVQQILGEPFAVFSSTAYLTAPNSLGTSECRTTRNGQEVSACVGCKAACIDIDPERSYWSEGKMRDRKVVYYAYLGLVIGFYGYFTLYSGNSNFLRGAVWTETDQLATLLNPGFYIADTAIGIPKLIAAPLTLAVSSGLTYILGLQAEHIIKTHLNYNKPLHLDLQHRLFAGFTFLAFNCLFFMGTYPTLGYLPIVIQNSLAWAASLLSGFWLIKNWQRSQQQYYLERDAVLLKKQLQNLTKTLKLDLTGNRSIEALSLQEIDVLVQTLSSFNHQHRLELYKGILKDVVWHEKLTEAAILKRFKQLRKNLQVSETDHWNAVKDLSPSIHRIHPIDTTQVSGKSS